MPRAMRRRASRPGRPTPAAANRRAGRRDGAPPGPPICRPLRQAPGAQPLRGLPKLDRSLDQLTTGDRMLERQHLGLGTSSAQDDRASLVRCHRGPIRATQAVQSWAGHWCSWTFSRDIRCLRLAAGRGRRNPPRHLGCTQAQPPPTTRTPAGNGSPLA